MSGHTQRMKIRRVTLLALLAPVGGVAMAGPMICSEIGGSPALMRVFLGLFCGGLLVPLFVVATWRKHVFRAWLLAFVPPAAAAVFAAVAWSDDYSFTHIAIPLAYVTIPLAFALLPDQTRGREGQCRVCGYDLRANPRGLCPECGEDPAVATGSPIRVRLQPLAWLLLALLVSATAQFFCVRGILSLG